MPHLAKDKSRNRRLKIRALTAKARGVVRARVKRGKQ